MSDSAVSSQSIPALVVNKLTSASIARKRPHAIVRAARLPLFVLTYILWVVGLWKFVRPHIVFMVYGTKKDQNAYWPQWLRSFLLPAVPIGLMRCGNLWGLVLASPLNIDELQRPLSLDELFSYLFSILPQNTRVALAGSLPSWLYRKTKKPVQSPYVDGAIGTCWTVTLAAQTATAERLGRTLQETTVCVLGGAGYIGSQVVSHLAKRFKQVVAIDPRFDGEEEGEVKDNIIYLPAPNERVREAQLVIVLTSQGKDAESVVPWLAAGAVVLDDTHPYIPREIRHAIRLQGARLLKVTMAHAGFTCTPRLPGFGSQHIPGCLFQTIVEAQTKKVFEDLVEFGQAAARLGFVLALSDHPEDG